MARMGYIYLITNKIDGMKYVGQTSRDIDTRFEEHCTEKRGNSRLHNAIQKYGWLNFQVEELECVPIEELDEKEKYWIDKLDTFNNGYNLTLGGFNTNFNVAHHQHIRIVENGLIIGSKEELARLISETTSWWTVSHLRKLLADIIEEGRDFLGYHIEPVEIPSLEYLSDENVIIDWIKTLNAKFIGKHVYCPELQMEFNTVGEAAKYLIDNGLYTGSSKTPIQSLVTSIGKILKGKTNYIKSINGNLRFISMPGSTKNLGGRNSFSGTKVYCPEIDKYFESQIDAAKYLVENNIWTGIKLKTARLRISNIVNGIFPNYRGLTFQRIE